MPVVEYGNHEFLTKIEENRDRLADDAVLLISNNRLKSAHALLILSIEEQGKLLIEIWKNQNFAVEFQPRQNYHIIKHVAFYSLILAGKLRKKFAILPENIANLIPYDRLKTESDFHAEFLSKSTEIRYAKIGVYNKLKQLALYVDHDSIILDFNDTNLNKISLDRMLSNLNHSKIYVDREDYLTFARIIFSVTVGRAAPDTP